MAGLDLGKQIGPLPLGAWIAATAGAIGLGWWVNRGKATEAAEPVLLAEPGVGAGGAQFIYDPPTAVPLPEGVEETNHIWGMKVVRWLIAQGYDPGISDNAIRKALASLDLSVQEQALWNLALKQFGPPPEPLAPVNIAPIPPAPTPIVIPPPSTSSPILAPQNLRVISSTSSSITIQWERVPNGIVYRVQESSALGRSDQRTIGTIYRKSGLAPNLSHTFTVRAVTLSGEGPGSTVTGSTKVALPTVTRPAPPQVVVAQRRTHLIKPGDTLSGISLRYLGAANRWMEVYNLNRSAIEDAARRHGKTSSSGGPRRETGWWIYPGTTLNIP